MFFNFKNINFLIIIFIGLSIFLFNVNKLNLNNEGFSSLKEKNTLQTVPIKPTAKISNNNINNLNNELQNNSNDNKYTETILIVKKGETFSNILDNLNFKRKKKFEIINSINEIFDLRDLKANQKIIFLKNDKSIIKKIIIELDFKTNLLINLSDKINVAKRELEIFSDIESKEYLIKNSLYADGIKNNIPNQVLIKIIQLFSFDIDFQRDIRENTQVSISYEKVFTKNKSDFSIGDIQYARITIKNNTLEYFKFITDEGFIDYFNRQGKNVKKSILKTPLDGARLSSSFGMRKHPISGFNKLHKGVDFAAPKGTPIYAGGDGTIEYASRNGGYGKYIRIRHNNDYKTAYAHLSKFKKGISTGKRVNQGDIIGYVGSTGNSTGPHLHYEILYKNKQINPMKMKLPSGKILKGNELERFNKSAKDIYAKHLYSLYE